MEHTHGISTTTPRRADAINQMQHGSMILETNLVLPSTINSINIDDNIMEITTAREAMSDTQDFGLMEAAALGHSNTDSILTNSVLCAKKRKKSTNWNEWKKVKVQQAREKGLAYTSSCGKVVETKN